MVQFNFSNNLVNCKIVYYGPGLSGKTTNLQMIYRKTPLEKRDTLTKVVSPKDRTLFFDSLEITLEKVKGLTPSIQLFSVPGQKYYNATRRFILNSVDGVVFIGDSRRNMKQENIDSLSNLEDNLIQLGRDIAEIPVVIQWNKIDMKNTLTKKELDYEINYMNYKSYEGCAIKGIGVFPTLKECANLVFENLKLIAKKKDPQQ